MTNQPKWKLLAQLGDANPIEYGGFFVYCDETGVYPEEAELLISPEEDTGTWIVYRFVLDRLKRAGEDGQYLVPFAYEPTTWKYPVRQYDEWFNEDLSRVASFVGQDVEEMRDMLCSGDAVERAFAYRSIGEYHGFLNLDSYPVTFNTREEVEARYSEMEEK